jgi:hypothetical protein
MIGLAGIGTMAGATLRTGSLGQGRLLAGVGC